MIVFIPVFLILFAQAMGNEDIKPIAVITSLQGDVKIYHNNNKGCTNAVLEEELFLNDSLITYENSEVTILYSDGKIASFGPNTGIKISPSIDTIQRGNENQEEPGRNSSTLSPLFAFSAAGERTGIKILVRGEEDSLALKIYEPGNTALGNNKPDMIWRRFPNAQSYNIILQRLGNIIWQKTSTDTFLKYPEDAPELAPGTYLLKVVAIKGNDTLNSAERFFKVLKSETFFDIINAIDNIKRQNPDSFTLHYLSARIYEENGLVLDAIKEYEILLKMKPNEPLIHRSLSILYNKYGLPELGNKHLDCYEELTKKKK